MVQQPVVVGLLVCEQIIIEERTGNVTPVNCFSRKFVPQFPAIPFSFVALAFLTNGSGEVTLEVVIHRLDSYEDIYRRSHKYLFASPLDQVRCAIRINDCPFPVEGQYEIALCANNEIIAQRKITIAKEKK